MDITPYTPSQSDRDIINQIIQMIKNRQLTPEQLEKLLPQSKEFLENLNQAINKEIEMGHVEMMEYMKSTQKIIELVIISGDKEESDELKKYRLDKIDRMHERETDLQDKKDKRRTGLQKFWGFLGVIFMIILGILTAGAITGKSSSNNQA